MPVRRFGEYCASCAQRPVVQDRLCAECLSASFPEALTALEVDLTISLMTRRERFNQEAWAWINRKESK